MPASSPMIRLERTKYARLFSSRTRSNRCDDMPLNNSSMTSLTA
jgi:hypothetical protein